MLNVSITGLAEVIYSVKNTVNYLDKTAAEDLTRSAADEVMEWYRQRGVGWFDNPSLPTHGAGRKRTNWTEKLSRNWHPTAVEDNAFDVVFDGEAATSGGLLNFIQGGRITARGKALAIPLTPEAHGVSARQFDSVHGVKLFTPKGKDYLAMTEDDELRPVYLFRKSVDITPLFQRSGRKAIPDNEELRENMTEIAATLADNFVESSFN